jgi:hypothetical protein
MTLQIDTAISNRAPSERLIGMLKDLVNDTNAIFNSVKEIRAIQKASTISKLIYY